LTDRLRAAGFVPEDQETVLIGVAADMAADPVTPDSATPGEVTADEVVSAAWIIYHPGTEFAYLAGGSTLETWRKRGLYRALVAVRAR
jgi:hypothetical protein